jgi:hypothetical protein
MLQVTVNNDDAEKDDADRDDDAERHAYQGGGSISVYNE